MAYVVGPGVTVISLKFHLTQIHVTQTYFFQLLLGDITGLNQPLHTGNLTNLHQTLHEASVDPPDKKAL